jgi:hypothetical protein
MYYRTEATGLLQALVGFHGEVTFDRTTYAVLRLTYEMEGVPKDFPVHASFTTVTYDFADIAGRRYLLPARSQTEMNTRSMWTWNHAEFRGYRKFETDSKVTFTDEK